VNINFFYFEGDFQMMKDNDLTWYLQVWRIFKK